MRAFEERRQREGMVENIRAGISRNSKPEFGGSFGVENSNYAYTKTSNYSEHSNTNECTKIKTERGITLVALIITVVIMLILATVTISEAFGNNGLIEQAKLTKMLATNSIASDQASLDRLMQEYSNIMAEDSDISGPGEGGGDTGGNTTPGGDTGNEEDSDTVAGLKPESGEPVEILTDTTTITDDLENSVVIPGGFGVAEDSGTKVEKGIVIEDDAGNQFVWIPTGTYNVSTTINASGQLTNNLSRRTFTSTGATAVYEDNVITSGIWEFSGEGTIIGAFIASANDNGGFYIGRYEQGEGNVCISNVNPITNVTNTNAVTASETMYSDNTYVTSQLVSSYAWDTILNFICQTNEPGYTLATTTSNTYGNFGSIQSTGAYEYSNIYDLIGNCDEWTSEIGAGNWGGNSVARGAWTNASSNYQYSGHSSANYRGPVRTAYGYSQLSFRVQLYIK